MFRGAYGAHVSAAQSNFRPLEFGGRMYSLPRLYILTSTVCKLVGKNDQISIFCFQGTLMLCHKTYVQTILY